MGLGGNTTIFIMEEGEIKGICDQRLNEEQKNYWERQEAAKERQNRLWNRVLTKFYRTNISSLPPLRPCLISPPPLP
jgi:hypothetical protein